MAINDDNTNCPNGTPDLTSEITMPTKRDCNDRTPFFVRHCPGKSYPPGSIVYNDCGYFMLPGDKWESLLPENGDSKWVPFTVNVLVNMFMSFLMSSSPSVKKGATGECRPVVPEGELRDYDGVICCALEDTTFTPQEKPELWLCGGSWDDMIKGLIALMNPEETEDLSHSHVHDCFLNFMSNVSSYDAVTESLNAGQIVYTGSGSGSSIRYHISSTDNNDVHPLSGDVADIAANYEVHNATKAYICEYLTNKFYALVEATDSLAEGAPGVFTHTAVDGEEVEFKIPQVCNIGDNLIQLREMPDGSICMYYGTTAEIPEFYVCNGGDDADPYEDGSTAGTRGNPFATISHALKQIRPGTYVNVKLCENQVHDFPSSTNVRLDAGTQVRIRPYGTEHDAAIAQLQSLPDCLTNYGLAEAYEWFTAMPTLNFVADRTLPDGTYTHNQIAPLGAILEIYGINLTETDPGLGTLTSAPSLLSWIRDAGNSKVYYRHGEITHTIPGSQMFNADSAIELLMFNVDDYNKADPSNVLLGNDLNIGSKLRYGTLGGNPTCPHRAHLTPAALSAKNVYNGAANPAPTDLFTNL